VTHLVNDVQTKDKIKKRNGNKYFKMYSVKKKETKKKEKSRKTKINRNRRRKKRRAKS
jgi:hypothetical protein